MTDAPSPRDVAQLLMQVAHGFMRDIHRHLRHYHKGPRVTMPQIRVLHMAAEGAPTLSEIAEALRVTRPTATRLVDGLEERGWVRREPDPQDRRRVRLRTTEAGRRVVEGVQDAVYQYIAQRLAGLAPEELRTLYEGLLAVQRLFRAPEGTPEDAEGELTRGPDSPHA